MKDGDTGTVGEFWTDSLKDANGKHIWRMRVYWDKGSSLSLIAGKDSYVKVGEEEA